MILILTNSQLNQLLVRLVHVTFSCGFWEHSIAGICHRFSLSDVSKQAMCSSVNKPTICLG